MCRLSNAMTIAKTAGASMPVLLFLALRFLVGAGFRGLAGGELAAARRGPSQLIHLLAARKAQRVGWNVFRDHRAGSDIGAIAHAHGRDERCIAADEDALADGRGILVHPVVVASNCAGADVRAAADVRIAKVGEVHGLYAFAKHALLHFDKVAHARVFLEARSVAEMRERAGLRSG